MEGQMKSAPSPRNDEEKTKKQQNYTVPFYKLFTFADTTDMLLMIMGTAGALGNGSAQPLMTVLFGNLVDSFGATSDVHDVVPKISKISLHFVYLAVGSGISSFLQVACWMATGERQVARIRNMYLEAILRQEIAFFDNEMNTGEVIARISGDTLLIQDAMGEKVGKAIQLTSTFLGGIIVAFVQGWHLSLIMLSMIPLLVASGMAMATVLSKMSSRGQTSYMKAAVIVDQTIGSIRTVVAYTGEDQAVEKYRKLLKSACVCSAQEGLAAGLGFGTMMLFVFVAFSLGILYGAILILHNGYTGATVINVIFAVLIGSSSLGQASPCVVAFAAGQSAAFKIFQTIYRKPVIDAYDIAGKKSDNIQGDIEFRDVYFSYPARPSNQIFRRFYLQIHSGMTMALVGDTGSGKSTVISLIERFYDPLAGEVLIDGVNLKEFQLRWIREKIGLVSQEPPLFASSIRDNIAYGKDKATMEDIRAAAELANALKFIEEMPQGMDTLVGEHGTLLSGGQKQRIAIARAILKDPRILLLDEATSALDAVSEQIVQKALDRVMPNRTTVIVAHRLSTVRNANIITVLRHGEIVEKGSHSELLKDPNGAYNQLMRTQEINADPYQTNQKPPESLVDNAQNLSHHTFSNHSSELGENEREQSFSAPSKMNTENEASAVEKQETDVPIKQIEVPIRRLALLGKPELVQYIFGVTAAIVDGLTFPIFGWLLSEAIVSFYQPPPKLQKDSRFWSLMFMMLGFSAFLATTTRTYFFAVAGSKLIRRIRLMTFKKVIHMDIGWFDDPKNSSGVIGARLSGDAATIRSLVGDALSLLLQNTTTLIAGLVIAFAANWKLSLFVLAFVPFFSLNYWIQIKFIKESTSNAKKLYEEAGQVANEAVANIRTVASFSAEEKVMGLFKMKCEGPIRTRTWQGVTGGAGFGVSNFLLYCVDAAIFFAAAHLLQKGQTTFREIFLVVLSLAIAAIGVSLSNSVAPDSTKAKSATASVFAILDQMSKLETSGDSAIIPNELNGSIEFRHVKFQYPTRPDVQIFQDLCLDIQSGMTVALVGESGSGKSTVISLLQRFYDPDSGNILLDGVEIQKLPLKWLRQQMGLVSQEPTLFNDSVRANISYGKEGQATEAEIITAAELANAHEFVSSLQQGYETNVGERGIQLSGGQKQRIAIARAIVKDPRILLLDEATSALDVESERLVQSALNRVMVKRTTVIVAHRLSTIRGADLIAVLKNGVIIEKGVHETLINIKDGAYASLTAVLSTSPS